MPTQNSTSQAPPVNPLTEEAAILQIGTLLGLALVTTVYGRPMPHPVKARG